MKKSRFILSAMAIILSSSFAFSQSVAKLADKNKILSSVDRDFIQIEGKDFQVSKYEVTQRVYFSLIGKCTTDEKFPTYPVGNISWFDSIYFCNKLSINNGLQPVYSVDGEVDVEKWNFIPGESEKLSGTILYNTKANGYRLPTREEWEYAAKGGENFDYAGSNRLDLVAWTSVNSGTRFHVVGCKKPNAYGLYDMTGNVSEWCYDKGDQNQHYRKSGGFDNTGDNHLFITGDAQNRDESERISSQGIRLFRNTKSVSDSEVIAETKALFEKYTSSIDAK